jgi:hypothetical protein
MDGLKEERDRTVRMVETRVRRQCGGVGRQKLQSGLKDLISTFLMWSDAAACSGFEDEL